MILQHIISILLWCEWLVGVGRNRTLMTKDRQHFRALFGWVRLVVTYPKLPATEVSGSPEESRNLTTKVK